MVDFISNLISDLSWPITVIILVLILRRQIGRLLASLTKVRYRDLEVEFQQLAESAESLPSVEAPSADIPQSDRAIYTSLEYQILDVAARSPSASILLAWASLESAISAAVARLAISPEPPRYRSVIHNIEQLQQYADLPREVIHTINEMRTLRNRVAHGDIQRIILSPESSMSYAETAIRLTQYLNNLRR